MKDTANSPTVIGPGYQRDPPPKVITPGCTSGDCGCDDCKTNTSAKPAPKVIGPAVVKPRTILRLMSAPATSEAVLRRAGFDASRPFDGAAESLLLGGALTWSPEVYAALAEQLLEGVRYEASEDAWYFVGTSRDAMGPQTITAGARRAPAFFELEGLTSQIEWLLMGGSCGSRRT